MGQTLPHGDAVCVCGFESESISDAAVVPSFRLDFESKQILKGTIGSLYKRVTINSANDSLALTGVIEDLEVSLRFLCIIVLDLVIVLLQEDYCNAETISGNYSSEFGISGKIWTGQRLALYES